MSQTLRRPSSGSDVFEGASFNHSRIFASIQLEDRAVLKKPRGRSYLDKPSCGPSRKPPKAAALLACWALLLQVLIPLGHAPAAQALMSDRWLASICHSRAVASPVSGDYDTDRRVPTRGARICPICLGLHLSGTFLPPPAGAVTTPALISAIEFGENQRVSSVNAYRLLAQARAPPSIA